MALQKHVHTTMANAVPGDRATLNPVVYLAQTPLAGGEVRAGTFAWISADGTGALNGALATGIANLGFMATPDNGNAVAGTLTLNATGDGMAAAFSPGSFQADTADASSLTGTIRFTVGGFEDGVVAANATPLAVFSGGSAQLTGNRAECPLGALTVTGASVSGGILELEIDFAVSAAALGVPAGVVERSLGCNPDPLSGSTDAATSGEPVLVALRGDYWVQTATGATAGNAVYAAVNDGSVAVAGTGQTLSGYVETGWVAVTGGEAGDMIIISNWSA